MVWQRLGVVDRSESSGDTGRPTTRERLVTALGLLLVALAVPGALAVSGTAAGRRWSALRVDDPMAERTGPARFVEVLLTDVAKPALVVASAVLVLWCVGRRSRQTAMALGLTVLASNVTVQVVKHSPVDPGGLLAQLGPLSGHATLVAAFCLGCLLVAPPGHVVATALSSCALTVVVCIGVMAMGWHDPSELVAPLMICLGWALVAWPRVARRYAHRRPPGCGFGYPAAALMVGGAVLASFGLAASSWPTTVGKVVDPGVESASVFIVGAVLLTVGALLAARASAASSTRSEAVGGKS